MNIDDGKIQGDLHPLKFEKNEEGKKSGPLKDMPLVFREKFHKSIIEFLKDIPKSDGDWCYSINDVEEGLSYHLYYFNSPSEKSDYVGYMVVCRVGVYDLDKKEMLPDGQDKMIVFKFVNVEDLL